MHPLHAYVADQLAQKLKARRVVVWYDDRNEFATFFDELRGAPALEAALLPVTVANLKVQLVEYRGSFFEIRALVEPIVSSTDPPMLVVYVAGVARDDEARRGSVLMELEKAGIFYEPQLKRLARNVLREHYTDVRIDELLKAEVTWEELMRSASHTSGEPPSALKSIFHDVTGSAALLASWLVSAARDSAIQSKEASTELRDLIRAHLGLEADPTASLAKVRANTLRYVLVGEFRTDLSAEPPASVEGIPTPKTKAHVEAVRSLARLLRTSFPVIYPALADLVEKEVGLSEAKIAGATLGDIDTFRFEERALLGYCGELIAARKFSEALEIVRKRGSSFWLDWDIGRKAQWEAARRMAELGGLAGTIRAAVGKLSGDANAWIDAYTQDWHRLDLVQRRLEAWVANLDDDPDEHPLAIARHAYEETCNSMAEGFVGALVKARWAISGAMHQTRIFGDIVSARPKPVAYFLVDAMRFEMGVELQERLPRAAEVSLRPAICALPSITPIGMAALQPGAATSFTVAEKAGKFGARIDDSFLPDLAARKKFAAGRIPALADLTLDKLLSLPLSKLKKEIGGAEVIFVRSQEIDHAGETGFTFQARQVMDRVIDNLVRAIGKLAAAGVANSVVTADHGHLFYAGDRDESMRTEAPGGATVDLHRRCWIGRGGATPPGAVRVPAAALGYASDLDLVFPVGGGVFKAGGDLSFHHGGPSLQELLIPVVTIRTTLAKAAKLEAAIVVKGLPYEINNRVFSVTLLLGGDHLFASDLVVRPILVSDGRQVGSVGMAVGVQVDDAGCVELGRGKTVTIALLLKDDAVKSLRIVVQDPSTDVELYRSPNDIAVRLGV